MTEEEKQERKKTQDDIRRVLHELGLPVTHHDGHGYFEVQVPELL